jgi:hypothetical protein
MSLKLNKVEEKIQLEAIANDERRLSKVLAPDSKARGRGAKGFSSVLGDIYFELGTAYYQQERENKTIREYLALAGHYLTEKSAYPSEPATVPTEFEKALALAVCFGTKEDVAKALSVSNDYIFTPTDDEMRRHYQLSMDYLHFVRAYLSSSTVDLNKVEAAIKSCKEANAWKLDAVQTHAKLTAIAAIVKSDAAKWNSALSILVAEHKEESIRGGYQRLNLAFIALPALLLAKLGIAKTMTCSVSSPYLPLSLL